MPSQPTPARLALAQECYGAKLLVVRHPTSGVVSVLDAHCFHMGTALAGGDIEDLHGHSCIVCPAHRYRIDLATGCRVETDLGGHPCAGAQQQRVYSVHCDADFIFVNLPEVRGPPLASDYYNQAQRNLAPPPQQSTPDRAGGPQSYGLFGAAPAAAAAPPPPSPLQPYAAYTAWPVVPGGPTRMAESPPLVLSQPAPRSPAPALAPTRINFPAVKADPPHIARRKAATAAIRQKSYQPPTAESSPMQSPAKPAPPAAAPAPPANRQRTLFEAWGARALTTAATDDAMES